MHHHDAGADSAKRLKEKAEKADHEVCSSLSSASLLPARAEREDDALVVVQARKLRQEAAAKYDSSQELSRQVLLE